MTDTVRVPDEIIQRHPDDNTPCPAHSWPVKGGCDRIGTGIHANMPDFSAMSEEEIKIFCFGPIDVQHMIEHGEVRRTPPTHGYTLTFVPKLTVEVR